MNNGILTIVLAICVIALGLYSLRLRADADMWKEELALYRDKYHYRSGWSSGGGGFSYNLFTNDGGEHWYAFEDGVIVGPADDVYPGLVERLEAWDAIVHYAEAHGPLTLESEQEIELLERAGFSVERR